MDTREFDLPHCEARVEMVKAFRSAAQPQTCSTCGERFARTVHMLATIVLVVIFSAPMGIEGAGFVMLNAGSVFVIGGVWTEHGFFMRFKKVPQ